MSKSRAAVLVVLKWLCRPLTTGQRGEVIGAGCGEGAVATSGAGRSEIPMRSATDADLAAQRESWVRGEMAIGLDRAEAADRAAWRAAGTPKKWPAEPVEATGCYTVARCAECGGLRMVRTGTCTTCQDCGASGGCG